MTTQSYDLGGVMVHRINDIDDMAFDPIDLFPELTTSEVTEISRESVDGKLHLSFGAYLIVSGARVLLVDSGVGTHKVRTRPGWNERTSVQFLDGLAQVGYTPRDVDTVILTHLHADHVGWNTTRRGEGWEPTFAHATYFASEGELAWGAEQFSVDRAFNYGSYADSVLPLLQADVLTAFSSQHHFDDRVTARTRSGHTPGSTVVHVRGRRDTMVLSGDVIHHPVQGRRPELCSRFCVDNSSSAKTRVEVLRIAASRNHILAPAHFPWGRVRSADDGQFTFHALN